ETQTLFWEAGGRAAAGSSILQAGSNRTLFALRRRISGEEMRDHVSLTQGVGDRPVVACGLSNVLFEGLGFLGALGEDQEPAGRRRSWHVEEEHLRRRVRVAARRRLDVRSRPSRTPRKRAPRRRG